MAAADVRVRKRDRLKARARRYVDLPLKLRTADLPRRAASAVVMLAITAAAVWQGGAVLDGFIALVAVACFVEFLLLVLRATQRLLYRLMAAVAGGLYIGGAALLLMAMDRAELMIVVGAVIGVDVFAYFFGRAIGGPKIAPRISPSKTWAGLLGGAVGATIWLALAALLIDRLSDFPHWEFVPLVGALLAVVAQIGDFFESWLKRRAGKKDSSNLIPGHGGVFDRVDGLLPVALIVGALTTLA